MNTWTAILMMVPLVMIVILTLGFMLSDNKEATIFSIVGTVVFGVAVWGFVKGLAYFGVLHG